MNVSVILSVGNTIIWSPADFVRLPTDKEIISLILIVGLFEIWETEPPKIQKNAFKKSYKIDFHFKESNNYLILNQSARFLPPRCLWYR